MNKQGYVSFDEVVNQGMKNYHGWIGRYSRTDRAIVLDTKPKWICKWILYPVHQHRIKRWFCSLVGYFASGCQAALVLVCNPGAEEEAITRLSRVGFDKILGHLSGVFRHGLKPVKRSIPCNGYLLKHLTMSLNHPILHWLDIRRASEFKSGHFHDAENKPLEFIMIGCRRSIQKTIFHSLCRRICSMMAASILKNAVIIILVKSMEGVWCNQTFGT